MRKARALFLNDKLKLRGARVSLTILGDNSARVSSCISFSIKFTANIQNIRILTMVNTWCIVISCNSSVREVNWSGSLIGKLRVLHNSRVVFHAYIYAKVFVTIYSNSPLFVIYVNGIGLARRLVFCKGNYRGILVRNYKLALDFLGRVIREVSKYRNCHTVLVNCARGRCSIFERIRCDSPVGATQQLLGGIRYEVFRCIFKRFIN